MARPGVIIVHSRPTAPDSTDTDLSKWYDETHIPDVLATKRVSAAARYQLVTPTYPSDEKHGHEGKPPFPYMAVYYLPDLGWLHEEGCEFWKLPLVVEDGRSVFEVGEFEMRFWEVVGRMDEDGKRTLRQAIFTYLNAEEGDGKDAETVLADSLQGLGDLAATGPVRSTLFKIDETNPSPPRAAGVGGGASNLLPKKRYLCIHEIFNGEVRTLSTEAKAFHYTLLGEVEQGYRDEWESALS